jgi:hypothetical protein
MLRGLGFGMALDRLFGQRVALVAKTVVLLMAAKAGATGAASHAAAFSESE